MGRSQVQRNRARGRGRGRGRGQGQGRGRGRGRGRGQGDNHDKQAKTLKSNAWRFEQESNSSNIDSSTEILESEIHIGAYGGPSHDSVQIHSLNWDDEIATTTSCHDNITTRINISLLQESLAMVPKAEWMRIPERHIAFMKKSEISSGDESGQNSNEINNERSLINAERIEIGEKNQVSDDNQEAEDPEDDLDCWLDSVIS